MKGVDRLDVEMAKTHEEEDNRQGLRYLYWFVIQTDLMFRLFFGKPAALRWTSERDVKLPPLFMGNVNVHAPQVLVYVVSLKYAALTAELFNMLDKKPFAEQDEEVHRKVDEYCEQLEELITEWDLEPLTKSSSQPIYADHLMNICASIIAVKRLIRSSSSSQPIDAITLRAARKVISTLLRYTAMAIMPNEDGIVFIHFISFYPFCAVFTLYEHILASPDPSSCDSDLDSLTSMETLLEQACTVHADLLPFSNIITALNKVARAMQHTRRNASQPQSQPQSELHPPLHPSTLPQTIPHPPLQPTAPPLNILHTLLSPILDPYTSHLHGFAFPSDFNPSEDFQPLGLVRALESDFIGRNWHEDWWDMDGVGVGVEEEFGGSR